MVRSIESGVFDMEGDRRKAGTGHDAYFLDVKILSAAKVKRPRYIE